MAKLISKIALPIILAGIFAIAVFAALNYERGVLRFYIVILIFSVYVFSFGFATGQSLVSPLKQLLDRATELSKGNLSSRVYLETKDEFAELARVFNQIAEELQASREQGENVEKSVGIKVQARTQDLQEIINPLEQKVKNRTIELERLVKQLQSMQAEVEHLKQQNKIKR